MLLAIAAIPLALVLENVPPQDQTPVPALPFDRVVELELSADDAELIDGRGPTLVFEYEAEFEGTLHVWTESELDLFLQIDNAMEARPLASDDNSGGGTTPYLRLKVEAGDYLAILVAGPRDVTGVLTLRVVAAPETELTRTAAAAGREAQREAVELARNGDRIAARELVGAVVRELANARGADHSQAIGDALLDLGAFAYNELQSFAISREAWDQARQYRWRSLPVEHPDLMRARINLALSMSAMGDHAGARALEEAVLAAYERSLPADHPDILAARGNLAVSMREMRDLNGARALQEAVLAAYERSLPADHPDILWARGNLASSMWEMGDLAGARGLQEAVLAAYERILPADHPDLLTTRSNLALSMREMGDIAGARALQEALLEARERSLPADHPDILTARANLAVSMRMMGDFAGARALKETVLAVREQSLSADHPDLLAARVNLANSMAEMGDLVGARALEEAVLAACEQSLPADHPDILAARANLAISMRQMGDLAGAYALKEAVLAARERSLPADHPYLLRARTNLAASMQEMGDFAGARALREVVLVARERSLPADHPDLLRARTNLANSMAAMGDLRGARALLPALSAGMHMRVLAALALAPRQVLGAVAMESHRLARVLSLSEAADPAHERHAFELTETMRLVAGEAARSLARFDTDPELAPILVQAKSVRRALNDLVAGAAWEAATRDDFSDELTRLSLERDRLEREASRRLADRGVVTQPVEAKALIAALGPSDVAIGYRRIEHWEVDETSGRSVFAADHLLAHVLTSKGTLTRVDLGPASELETLAGAWRRALGAPILRGVALAQDEADPELVVGRELRRRILDPVLELAGQDACRLFVCADDLLFLLPLDALPLDTLPLGDGEADAMSEDVERIGDRLQLVNEVSFARLLASAAPSTRKAPAESSPALLAFGGVDYDAEGLVPEGLISASAPIEDARAIETLERFDSVEQADENEVNGTRSARPARFQKLLQSRYEAEATADLFEEAFELEATLLTRKKTTKAALFEAAPGKRYVHLATHGWFAPESIKSIADANLEDSNRMGLSERVRGLAPMTLCGLALAGANRGRDSLGRVAGILTAEELCSLDLSQCELAVLSACETNVGIRRAGQGIQSLQAALYAAGARTSITSLWKVDDAATRRLMEVFYTNLWIEKLGKAGALWRAKLALREEGHPPSDWAGWVLTGDPD